MPGRIQLADHRSVEELGQRCRAARDPIEPSHLQIVWLAAQGHTRAEITAVTGYQTRWISTVIKRSARRGRG